MGEQTIVPPAYDKKQGEPKMTPRPIALVKRVARNLPFSGFAPLAVGRNWPTTAWGLPIQVTNLLLVRCSITTSTIDDRLI
jgi:hypothetical protein